MKSNKPSFVSLRTKTVLLFSLLLAGIIIISAIALPRLVRQYFQNNKLQEIENTKETVDGILISRPFFTDPEVHSLMNIAANSSDVAIWIAVERDDGALTVFAYGENENSIDDFAQFNRASFTGDEIGLIKDVLSGKQEGNFFNSFKSAFSGSTLSVGYRHHYLRDFMPPMDQIDRSGDMAAVFIHISMEDIVTAARQTVIIILAIIGVVCVACWIVMFVLSQNVILPVNRLQQAADAISKGDFSTELEVAHNDEIGQLTESFNTMTQVLKEADTMQRDFIANISHDFRSPLTSIKGFVEAIIDGTIPQEDSDKYLGIVLDETNRLTKLANNVLDLTKMENGQIELHPTDFDINETIVKLALGFEQRVDEQHINFDFQFITEKLFVTADIALIERVVYNLIDNALKFTDEGGTVAVETSIVGKKAEISVKDTGIGITEEALPYVFERFHKGDKSRGKDKKGTGLGLTIAKQIMLSHREDITVFSTPGVGTTFTFTLPLAGKNYLGKEK